MNDEPPSKRSNNNVWVDKEPNRSRVIFFAGKNRQGWWCNDDLVQQLANKVIPIFEALHPNARSLFIFDISSNHHAVAPDGLKANEITLRDGGKNIPDFKDGKHNIFLKK